MLWTQGAPVAGDRIVYVKHSDMETAQLHLSCADWPSVEIVVKVLPAGYGYIPIIDAFVRLQAIKDACQKHPLDASAIMLALSSLQLPVRDVVQCACELLGALQRFDVEAICSSGARLEAIGGATSALPTRSQRLLVKLAKFLCEFGRTSLHEWALPAFFTHRDPNPTNRNWWKAPSSLANSFNHSHQRFPTILNGAIPPSLEKIRQWINGFREQAEGLYLVPNSIQSESDVFRQASVFMAASADLHHARHSHILALLCLHRSVEWLLAAKCADLGLLDFTSRSGVKMASVSNELISYDLLRDALASNNVSLRGMESDLITLNRWRNLFAYTHHMSSPSVSDASDLFSRIRLNLSDIANNKWKENLRVLGAPWPVSLEDMLDPAGEIRDTFTVHQADALIVD